MASGVTGAVHDSPRHRGALGTSWPRRLVLSCTPGMLLCNVSDLCARAPTPMLFPKGPICAVGREQQQHRTRSHLHGPRCCLREPSIAPRSRDRTASGVRLLTSDPNAKVVSRASALTATFHFLRGTGDLPAQTGRSRAQCERQSSLCEESLPLSPGQLGSIRRLNGRGAGDYFSLADRPRFEPRWCFVLQCKKLEQDQIADTASALALHGTSPRENLLSLTRAYT